MPLADMPPGTVINNLEKHQGDKGKFAKTSGGFAQIFGHIEGAGRTRLRLLSRHKPRRMKATSRHPQLVVVLRVLGEGEQVVQDEHVCVCTSMW